MKRGGVLLTLWLVVAFTAIGVGTWALSLVGGRINDRSVQPLSQSDIQNELNNDQTASATATPGDTGSGTTSTPGPNTGTNPRPTVPSAGGRGLPTPGGLIVASCTDGQAYLKSWSPAQGYRADDSMTNGPGASLKFEFKSESDEDKDVEGSVSCVNSVPTLTYDRSHHGGRNAAPPAETNSNSGTSGSSGGVVTNAPTPTPSKTSGGGHGSDDPPGDDRGGR